MRDIVKYLNDALGSMGYQVVSLIPVEVVDSVEPLSLRNLFFGVGTQCQGFVVG